MSRRISACVLASCISCLPAQGFAAGLEAAQAKIEAKQWQEALELLLPLQDRAECEEDVELLAARLKVVGAALVDSHLDAALRARTAEAAMRKRLHGDRDHPDVASSRNSLAHCLEALGRAGEALPQFEQALAMWQRLHGSHDHADVATGLNNVAYCLQRLGRLGEALPYYEQALAMQQRLHPDQDHHGVATALSNIGYCLHALGQGEAALTRLDAALTMRRRLASERDDRLVAISLGNRAACLAALGRPVEALPDLEAAVAILQRLHAGRDDPEVANALGNLAGGLSGVGRTVDALSYHEQELAMWQRLFGHRDHPAVATALGGMAVCLKDLGRPADALPYFEQALAMRQRLFGGRDHPDTAWSLIALGSGLWSLGRAAAALPCIEQALAMRLRLFGNRDHPDVARNLVSLGSCLREVGRTAEAPPVLERALAMQQRLFGGRDHEDVVTTLNDLAIVLERSGAVREAIARLEQALAMATRLSSDHPSLATVRHNLGSTLDGLGRSQEARPHLEEALAMRRRLYGRHDHPRLVSSMVALASCLRSIGQATEALALAREACDQVDGLRHGSRVSAELRQALFDDLKRDGAFELLQRLACAGDPMLAFAAAERSRGRGLLDLLEQQRADPLHEAERRAAMRGDEAGAAKLRRLRADLAAAEVEGDRRLHALARLVDSRLPDAERQVQRRTLLAESDAVNQHRRQLLDERARLLADVLPVGRVRTAAEIQAALRIGEVLLEFTLTRDLALLYVVPRDGAVDVIELPQAFATVQRVVPALLQRSSHPNLRGRDPGGKDGAAAEATDAASRELFASLIPASAWERVRSAKHVFVAAHRELHRLPFELLVVDQKAGKAVHWLDAGPPISYLPSGSALHWLRQRSKEASDDSTSLDLLAVGDPRRLDAEPPVPEQGVFVVAVDEGGEGARVGLQPGDVLVGYDGKPLADDKALRDARMAVERAVEDKERDTSPIPIGVWRRGTRLTVEARPGPLGIQVGRGRARAAWEASRGGDAQLERITRAGDLERIGQLSPLRGARAETEAIEKVFADRKAQAKRLLGAEATEPAVFDLAPKAKYLHFACHGIAEEYAGQSLSMLVLSQPDRVLPGDDGLLQLADLWNSWRGRLASCRLVVLSACQTNVGPTQRDEAPQALPLGFLFAGAPAVISTLWPVDDASTKELMADFYARLLAGETDQLVAFTAAKKALRQKYPDPFHWAPFLYLGAPE